MSKRFQRNQLYCLILFLIIFNFKFFYIYSNNILIMSFSEIIKQATNIYNNIMNKLNENKLPNTQSGVYLLLCGYIGTVSQGETFNDFNIYKPGISNTNIYRKDKELCSLDQRYKQKTNQSVNQYIKLIKETLNLNYVKLSNEKDSKTVYKQLQVRNGTISKNAKKVFSSYESKENYLPVLCRYSLPIHKAIFIENYLTYLLKNNNQFTAPADLNFNHGRLFYNGYCYKAYLAQQGLRASGNETESKILNKSFETFFNQLMTAFNAETVNINQKQNQIKFNYLNEYYNQFKYLRNEYNPNLTYNDYLIQFRTNDIFKYKKTIIKLNYKKETDIEPTVLANIKLFITNCKNNKKKLSDINLNVYINYIVLALELHLVEYENSKIKYL